MATPLGLFKLFGNFLPHWPAGWVRDVTGWDPTGIDLDGWLAELDAAAQLFDVRTAVSVDLFDDDPADPKERRLALEGRLALAASALRPGGLPFVLASMPDVEFRVKAMAPAQAARFFVSQGGSGVDMVIEGLPVEILLPVDLVQPHPDDVPAGGGGEHSVGEFTVGELDSQKIVLRKDERASIFVHMRVKVTSDLAFVLTPAVPISFGRCRFLEGIECLALHDFQLIPSPEVARENLDWIRHGIEPWGSFHSELATGCFAVRTVHLDPEAETAKTVADWMARGNTEVGTEDLLAKPQLVLDDLVLSFDLFSLPPLARHITVGARRNTDNPLDAGALFDLEQAPIRLPITAGPFCGLVLDSVYYESQGLEAITENKDPGLRFHGALHWDSLKSSEQAMTIGLGENLTPRIGYRRELEADLGPIGEALLSWKFFGIEVDVLGLTAGYSIGRTFQPDFRVQDAVEFLVDLWIESKPGENKWLKLRTLDNAPPKFAVHGLGWKQGSFHLEGLALPDGFVWSIADYVNVIFQEIGMTSEGGVTYLSFSGGVLLPVPNGFEGGLTVKRLRFPLEDKEGGPPFKLDGFFGFWKSERATLEVGGYVTDEKVQDPQLGLVRREELGFTGDLQLKMAKKELRVLLDLLAGKISWEGDSFRYFLMQLILEGKIPFFGSELKAIRLLFANNMKPRLEPANAAAGEMRYYDWYKKSDPLLVPGSRRLAAWLPENDAWSLGLGCTIGITGLGSAALLRAFVLGIASAADDGLLVAVEFFALKAEKPLAWGVLEIDLDRSAWKLQLGVDVTLATLADSDSDWLKRAPKLTGTLLLGNKPGTIALGRLADPATWLSLVWDIDLWRFRTYLRVGFCMELVADGPGGVGLTVRIEGEARWGVVKLSYYVGFAFLAGTFKTGSKDQGLAVQIEAAIRAVLFKYLRFGLSAAIEYRYLCLRPSRSEWALRLRFETPWFLPDVTLDLEHASGEVAPERMALFTSPLQGGSAFHEATASTLPVHVERWDTAWTDDVPAATHSIQDFAGSQLSEAGRVQRFHANAGVRPIATDSTLAIDFTSPMNDSLAIGNVPPDQGGQDSGDLSLAYTLVGFEVRRRPRFGVSGAWHTVEERIELAGDFSDPDGVELEGSIEKHEIAKFWNPDLTAGARTTAKRLMVNASTPFDYATVDPYTDDVIVNENPNWPCCPPPAEPPVHEVSFREEPAGTLIVGRRTFSASRSRLRFLRRAVVRTPALPGLPGVLVAAVDVSAPGVLARADLDKPSVLCRLRLAWSGLAPAKLHLVAYDALSVEAGRKTLDLGTVSAFQEVELFGQRPFRRFDLLAERGVPEDEEPREEPKGEVRFRVEIDEAVYVTYQEWLRQQRDETFCDPGDLEDAYSGHGKLFFLPNHEYEIRVRTRLAAEHPSTGESSTEVDEYLYFATKGHPGLNAVERVGQEVEPYVRDVYPGGRGRVYREEPVALAFNEHYSVVVPVSERPPGTSLERQELLRLALTVRPDVAVDPGTVVTTTSDDWIVAHWDASEPPVVLDLPIPWRPLPGSTELMFHSARSVDPRRERLAGLTQRAGTNCPLGDPRDVTTGVLLAWPQGTEDPVDPDAELWRAGARFTAAVRPEGSPFVYREPFAPLDTTAFDLVVDGGAGSTTGTWTVEDGELRASAPSRQLARFGETDWNHLEVRLEVRPSDPEADPVPDSVVGVAFGLPAGAPSRGLFALLETAGGVRRLALYRRRTGTQMELVASAGLAGDAEAVRLVATAYDDVLRWAAGEAVVEVPRDELRAGRLALVAAGDVAFLSLSVCGLSVYEFPFQASRFRSFAEHVESFGGRLTTALPSDLGATATETVASLWSATEAEVAAAMTSGAAPEKRQQLFDRWTAGLVLPFVQDVDALEIARYRAGGADAALVIDSPEPLDFIDEVSAKLELLTGGPGPLTYAQIDQLEALAPDLASLLGPPSSFAGARASAQANAPQPGSPPASATTVDGLAGGGLRVRFDAALSKLAATLPMAALEVLLPDPFGGETSLAGAVAGGDPRLKIWRGTVAVDEAGVYFADLQADEIRVLELGSTLGDLVAALPVGALLFVEPATGSLIDAWWSLVNLETIEVSLLQDAAARRAIVVPRSGAGTRILGAGRYRLTLTMERTRWSTSAPADDVNHYRGAGTVVFDL